MYKAAEYLSEIVVPTVDEFVGEVNDPRRAMLAAMTVLHLVDHVFQNRDGDAGTANKATELCYGALSDRSNEFKAVRAFALAGKHARLSRSFQKGRGSKDFHALSPALADELECGSSILGDYEGGVAILLDGCEMLMVDCLRISLALLRREFEELQAVDLPETLRAT